MFLIFDGHELTCAHRLRIDQATLHGFAGNASSALRRWVSSAWAGVRVLEAGLPKKIITLGAPATGIDPNQQSDPSKKHQTLGKARGRQADCQASPKCMRTFCEDNLPWG